MAQQPPFRAPETMIGRPSAPGDAAHDRHTVIMSRDQRPKPLAFLVIISGDHAGRTLPLKDGVTRIGRDSTNDHAIDDDAVSSQHLSIRYRDGDFVATDLDSGNGTKVNGQAIDRQTLASNDVIIVGRTKLVFLRVEDARSDSDS